MSGATNQPALLILNQMAGPMTWELAEDLGHALGSVALLTGHPDTLQKSHPHVQMSPAAPYQRGAFGRRALSWVRYWLQAFVWIWRWPKETPLLFFSNPPILCWLGWLMARLRGARYAVMVHDIYPDVLVRLGHLGERHPLVRLWRRLNRRAYENARVVMTLGEYMAANLERQFDPARTGAGRVEIVYPWVDTERIRPIPKEKNWFAQKYDQVGKLTVMYSGNMGFGHDIETILDVAKSLVEEERIHFFLIGAGPKWEVAEAFLQNEVLSNVTLLSWQPEETVPYSLSCADVAVVSLEDSMAGLAIPSKTVTSLAAGSALTALVGVNNELCSWVERFGCGLAIFPGQGQRLVCALHAWLSNSDKLHSLQQEARLVAEELFSREGKALRFAELLGLKT